MKKLLEAHHKSSQKFSTGLPHRRFFVLFPSMFYYVKTDVEWRFSSIQISGETSSPNLRIFEETRILSHTSCYCKLLTQILWQFLRFKNFPLRSLSFLRKQRNIAVMKNIAYLCRFYVFEFQLFRKC